MAKLISFKQAVVGKGVCREPALVTLCELCVSQALSQLQDLPMALIQTTERALSRCPRFEFSFFH